MDHNKACAYYSKAAEQGVTYSRQVMRIFYSRGCGAFAIPVGMDLAIYDSRWLLRSYLNSFGFYPNPPIKDV
jgi:hypothetical protein